MVADLCLHTSETLEVNLGRSDIGSLILDVFKPLGLEELGPLVQLRNDVADESWLLVLVSSHKSLLGMISDQWVLAEVAVNFVKLDSETSNLDLVIGSTGSFNIARLKVTPQITCAVKTVTGNISLESGVVLIQVRVGLNPLVRFNKPRSNELFRVQCCVISVSLGETSGTDVDLTNLTNSTNLVAVLAVDDKELHILHSLTGWHGVSENVQSVGVLGAAGDLEVADSSLCLGCSIHVDNVGILGEFSKLSTISGGEDITNKECPVERWELGRCTSYQNLTHSWCQVSDGGLVLTHPFGELFMLNILLGGYQELGTKEERCEDVSLDRVVGDSRKKCELAFGCQVESLGHPREVSAETVMASQDTLGLSFRATGETVKEVN
ncbi:hypothetical protein HG531_006461 [Fusarium graminearum]|nr:hypothetical protein HG531_006461 [Fusarium graminearum]